MKADLVLGIDVGTAALKAGLYDLEGRVLGLAAREYPIIQPRPGWGEHDPERWWMATKEVVREVLKQAGARAEDVVGIGIDCLSPSMVLIDRAGRALRNAFTPLDVRSGPQVEAVRRRLGSNRVFTITGNRPATGTSTLPQLLWVREAEPPVYDRAYKFLHANGFLAYRMTGRATIDWSNAALTLLFDPRRRSWSPLLLGEFGIDEDKLPDPVSPVEVVGELGRKPAEELGLVPGIPVAGGSIDTNTAALGAGVVEEGQAIDSAGAASCLGVITREPRFDDRFLNRCHAVPDRWIIVSQGPHTGLALRWFRNELCRDLEAEDEAAAYRLMDQEAEKAPPGSEGLIYLPYFMGEASPTWNPDATGVFFGLTPGHTRGHLIRAIMEGTAFNIREVLDVLAELGVAVHELVAVGGQAKSPLWLRIRADITSRRLIVPQLKDTAPLGAAILGGVAGGAYRDPAGAARSIFRAELEVEPDPKAHRLYSEAYKLYLEVYSSLVGSFATRRKVISPGPLTTGQHD